MKFLRFFGLIMIFSLFLCKNLFAASCCGGGSSSSLVLPKFGKYMTAFSMGGEKYDGFWSQDGNYFPDPKDASVIQYQVNAGFAYRLATDVQASISLPWVWNRNSYANTQKDTYGLGDTSLGIKYEFFDKIRCVWKIRNWEDLLPAFYLGADILVPTGISPYGKSESSFDITGLGFYRLDGTMLLEKTISAYSATIMATFGDYLSRKVNREYGTYVEPYDKKLGQRFSMAYAFGYSYMMESMSTISLIIAYAYLREANGKINANSDPSVAYSRSALSLGLSYASDNREVIYKLKFNHTIKQDGWGRNFPATDLLNLEANYVFR